jgi:hypothetical protein
MKRKPRQLIFGNNVCIYSFWLLLFSLIPEIDVAMAQSDMIEISTTSESHAGEYGCS